MPQPEPVKSAAPLALVVLVLLLSACNSSTAFRRDASRGAYRQVAREVHIDPAAKSRGTAFTMVQVAQARLMAGDPAGAAAAAERALKADPASAEAHSLLALSMDATGRAVAAGPHHRRAAELAPGHGAPLNNYGIWLCSNGQARASLDWFERAAASPGYATPDAALANAAA
ncbi:MAG TPA: type IV pilus biogenesis/stability protein PilW, partial [Lysobacter sp.]